MLVDRELKKLAADFRRWRKRKQHVRERIPDELMKKARQAIPAHGAWLVAQTIGVEHARLTQGFRPRKGRAAKQRQASPQSVKPLKAPAPPAYSRLELPVPSASARPVAEVETAAGVKLKVFEVTPETVSLLSALTAARRAP